MRDFNKQETENLFSRLLDNANVLILYLDNHGYITMCNKKLEDITGKTKKDIIGSHWLKVLTYNAATDIKQQLFKAVVDDVITYRRLGNFESSIIDANKNEHLIYWSITPILLEPKEFDSITPLEGVLFIGNDITELKEREEGLKKIDQTLKDIFLNIKEYALYAINLDGNITYFGMGSESMFGWHKNEIIFKQISLLHIPEDATSKLPFILKQAKEIGQYETDIELVKKDGQHFPVTLTVSQFKDPQGQHIGYIFIAKDITEKKKLEYQIFQAEKLTAMGQLVAGMAHEINNPLFVISGRLEMILDHSGLDNKLKEELNIINVQTDRIRKLVDRLLKFSRKAPPKLETITINEIIDSVLSLLAYHKLPTTKIEIVKDLAEDLPPIKGDLNQLQEVFVNLCLNAQQAMSEGGRLTIKSSNSLNRFAEVKISDTGLGISQEELKNIFMPFFSTKKEGTGLGLSICYNIIKSHNGSIDIETELNKGTTFIIRLPFA